MKHKHLLLTLLLVLACINGFSQPAVGKQIAIRSLLPDQFRCMALTRDSGIIAGGYTDSRILLDKTESSRGGYDYWIVKLNKAGQIEWDKTIGGNRSDELQSIQQTIDGGYILGGASLSDISGEKTEDKKGNYDFWVVKVDASGNVEWDNTIGGNKSDYLYSVKQTHDGGYIAAGFSNSDISGDKTENSKGFEDYWLVKLDAAGQIQWDKTVGGNIGDILTNVIETTDNGYLLGGHSGSGISGDKTENSRGGADYWIVKLDSEGSMQWDKTIGGASDESFYSIQQTIDGGYIMGGASASNISGEKTENSRGSFDYWIVKTDSNANKEWDKTIGGVDEDYLNSLEQTTDGGYILGGNSVSDVSGEKTENSRGSFDFWIVKINKQGKYVWDKTIGGDEWDWTYAIKERKKDQYIIGGLSGSGISGDKTQPTASGDYWLVELNFTKPMNSTSSAEKIVVQRNAGYQNFTAYPNPAKDILHVQTTGKANITLTGQSGKIILTKTINNKGEINVSHLPAGLYYLKNVETGEVQKVIIIH